MGSGGTTKPPQFTQGQPTGLSIRNGDALSNFLSLSLPPVHILAVLLWLLTGGALFEVTGLSRPKGWAAETTSCNSICNLCRILMRSKATHRGKNSWGVSVLAPVGSADIILPHISLSCRTVEGQPRSVGGDCQMILRKRRPGKVGGKTLWSH